MLKLNYNKSEGELMTSKTTSLSAVILLATCLALLSAPLDAGQDDSGPDNPGQPEVIYELYHDVSPPLRDIEPLPETGGPRVIPLGRRQPPAAVVVPQLDPVLQESAGPFVDTTPGLDFLGVGVGLDSFTVGS